MQSNQPFLPQKTMLPLADGVGSGYNYDASARSFFHTMALSPGYNPALPSQNVKLQLSEACPKNFIIFDQTDFRSQIMFHPATASNFYPHLNINASSLFQEGMEKINANNEDQEISSHREDSDDIDALMDLMSFEEENYVESEDEELSTARTDANYGSSSPDSCSNYQCQSGKSELPYHKRSSVSGESCSKRKKLRKMVKTLRGIVPGANRMNTVAVLDETVRYLKSLKVEVQKLGIKNLRS